MKKVIIFLVIIIALFAGMGILNYVQNKEKLGDNNPYKTKDLHQETIDQLDDPNYQNIILPDELESKLENNEDVTVYFFASNCPHCKRTTPVLMPLADDMNIDVEQYNLLEFPNGWEQYGIEGTPTLVHFKNGKEVARIDGEREKAVFKQWFEQNVKK
ncbi:thioredoxin family protein [Bacillus sp. CGMCC 1.16607]|uniref:thioredoxin family protein n=1 Tax=Bacillus sp. CGMCC 1.16607 TaxID=3351842 RepID=UPI00363C76C2